LEYYNKPSEKPFEEWILDKNTGTHSEDFAFTIDDILRLYPETKWLLENKCNNNYNDYIDFFYKYCDEGHRIPTVCVYIDFEKRWEEYIEWLKGYEYGNVPTSKNGKTTPLSTAEYRYNKIKQGLRYYADVPVVYKDYTAALTGKNLNLIFHPKEFRTLSVREAMELMGLPKDFTITSGVPVHMTQNVPVCTAQDMTEQAIKFINGELEMSKYAFIKQNNIKQRIEYSAYPEPRLPFEN
jgi:site-specific DNA-cytosine methylase